MFEHEAVRPSVQTAFSGGGGGGGANVNAWKNMCGPYISTWNDRHLQMTKTINLAVFYLSMIILGIWSA